MGTISLDLDNDINLILGIDFGTTNTVVSFYDENIDDVVIIPIDNMNIFPTAIMFEKDIDDESKFLHVFGSEARDGAIIYPESTVLSIKSILGVENEIKLNISGEEHIFKPEQIVGLILEFIRKKADEFIQTELDYNTQFSKVVITVPANSTDKQKRKTKEACILAGFDEEDIHIRLEPSAAAISYAVSCVDDKKVLVYDFGGGTFDACVLEIKMDNKKPVVSIKSTSGDNNLGGNDIDKLVFDMIYEEFLKLTNGQIDLFNNDDTLISLRDKAVAIARLNSVSNSIKEKLSKTKSAKVSLTPFIQEPMIVNINMEITRDSFLNHKRVNKLNDTEEVFQKFKGKNLIDMINMTIDEVNTALSIAKINKDEIDEIFLVGGSSQIPIVYEKIIELFGKQPYRAKLNPALSISEGASYYGKMILSPESTVLKFIEKTIHSIGIEISGRRYLEIIEPNTPIPENGLTIEMKELLTTNRDFIDKMIIVVYEYTKNSSKNVVSVNEKGMKRLSGTTLKGIPKDLKGREKVSLSFTISRDNILEVTATSQSLSGVTTKLLVDELY